MAVPPEQPIDRRAFLAGAGAAGLVLAACGSGSAIDAVARAAPRARRSGLAGAIRGPVFTRGSKGFGTVAHVYNERYDSVLPLAVARPLNATDVRDAVRYLVAHGTRLRVRSGGHSYAGYSTLSNGVVLDMRNLRNVVLNRRAGTATIGVGAALIDVYRTLNAAGVTIPAGSCPSVGVGGHALGGGMGLAGRAFGLASDNIVAAQIVTADGKLRNVSATSDPGLLWALRGGGGGNFGVVTHLTFRVHPIPRSASWFVVNWPWSSASAALEAWLASAPRATDQLTSVFHLQTGPSVLAAGQYMGPSSDLGRVLAPLMTVSGASLSSGDQSYFGLMTRWAGCLGRSVQSCHTVGTRPGGMLERASFQAKSDYLTGQLSTTARGILVSAIERRQGQSGSGGDPVRLLRRGHQSQATDGDRLRSPQRPGLHPVSELQRRKCVAPGDLRQHAWARIRDGLPELHRPAVDELAQRLLREKLLAAGQGAAAGRPPPLLQLPAGDRGVTTVAWGPAVALSFPV